MTVTAVRKDAQNLTMTVEAEFEATPERVWQLWADPRQLERWWGPPMYPATVTAHDLRPGGRVEYHMTGPQGDQPHGYWEVLEAEFEATPERVWQLWADPRQLERWWGPPMYPATVTAHDLRPGGRVEYHMTGPQGDQPHGYWEVLEAEPPRRLAFRDGFADADGRPNSDMPMTRAAVRIDDAGGGRTRMLIESTFPDTAAMEQMLAMGMEQGLREAVGQIDAILASTAASPAAR